MNLNSNNSSEFNINSCKDTKLRELLLSLVYFGDLRKMYNELKNEED